MAFIGHGEEVDRRVIVVNAAITEGLRSYIELEAPPDLDERGKVLRLDCHISLTYPGDLADLGTVVQHMDYCFLGLRGAPCSIACYERTTALRVLRWRDP